MQSLQGPKEKGLMSIEPVNKRDYTRTQAFSVQVQCTFSLQATFLSKERGTGQGNGLKGVKRREV